MAKVEFDIKMSELFLGSYRRVESHSWTAKVLLLCWSLTTHPKLKSLFLSFLPPAPFPCGLIKARQALEEEWLGQKRLPRGLHEHGDDVAKWNESMEAQLGKRSWNKVLLGKMRP